MPPGFKAGGRQKGTKNKATTKFARALESAGFFIPIEAVNLFRDTDTKNELKYKLLVLMANYSNARPPAEQPMVEEPQKENPDVSHSDLLKLAASDVPDVDK